LVNSRMSFEEKRAGPGIVGVSAARQPIELQPRQTAGLQHPANLAQILEHHVAAGDVLEHGVGIDEVEGIVRELRQTRAVADVGLGIRDIAQFLASQTDHLVGDVHAVNLDEVAAHGAHQPARPAADLQSLPAVPFGDGNPPQLGFQAVDHFGCGGEESGVVLITPPEGDIIARVLAGARIPVLAHPF